jgi:hypothetical protein
MPRRPGLRLTSFTARCLLDRPRADGGDVCSSPPQEISGAAANLAPLLDRRIPTAVKDDRPTPNAQRPTGCNRQNIVKRERDSRAILVRARRGPCKKSVAHVIDISAQFCSHTAGCRSGDGRPVAPAASSRARRHSRNQTLLVDTLTTFGRGREREPEKPRNHSKPQVS